MNYLAHAYLSFNNPGILAGNMISDFVKGRKKYDYSSLIRKGIELHRSIDSFTDEHPSTKEIKKIFRPAYRLYSGAFTDIVYDYFLANDKNEFQSPVVLQEFASRTYATLEKDILLMPAVFQQIFPYMRTHNWFYNYQFEWGIQKSFAGLARRALYIEETGTAYELFVNNIPAIKPHYDEFFPLLKKHAAHTLRELLNSD